MEELIGYVAGNNQRSRILALLASEAQGGSILAKRIHIAENTVIKILEDLVEKGLVKKDGNKYSLTETGVAVERQVLVASR